MSPNFNWIILNIHNTDTLHIHFLLPQVQSITELLAFTTLHLQLSFTEQFFQNNLNLDRESLTNAANELGSISVNMPVQNESGTHFEVSIFAEVLDYSDNLAFHLSHKLTLYTDTGMHSYMYGYVR